MVQIHRSNRSKRRCATRLGARNGTGFAQSRGETATSGVGEGGGEMMYLRKQINVVSGNEGPWWVAACLLSLALIAVALLTRGALV